MPPEVSSVSAALVFLEQELSPISPSIPFLRSIQVNQPKATVRKLVPVQTFFVNIEEINKQGKAEEVSYLAFFNPRSPDHKLTLARVTKLELSVAKSHITDQFLLEKLSLDSATDARELSTSRYSSSPAHTKPSVKPPVKPNLAVGNTKTTPKSKETISKPQRSIPSESRTNADATEVAEEYGEEESPRKTEAFALGESSSQNTVPSPPKRGRPKKVEPASVNELEDATP